MKRLTALFFLSLALTAQSAQLTLSSSPGLASAGTTITLTISLITGGGPAGIQWNMTGVPIGATIASTVTGKTASCNGSTTVAPSICILSGLNTTAIADGSIATIQYTQPATAPTEVLVSPLSATPAGAAGSALTPAVASNCDINKDGIINSTDVNLEITALLGPSTTPPTTVIDVIRVLVAGFGGVCLR